MAKAPIFIYNSAMRGFATGTIGCQIFSVMGAYSGIGAAMTNACIAYDRYLRNNCKEIILSKLLYQHRSLLFCKNLNYLTDVFYRPMTFVCLNTHNSHSLEAWTPVCFSKFSGAYLQTLQLRVWFLKHNQTYLSQNSFFLSKVLHINVVIIRITCACRLVWIIYSWSWKACK